MTVIFCLLCVKWMVGEEIQKFAEIERWSDQIKSMLTADCWSLMGIINFDFLSTLQKFELIDCLLFDVSMKLLLFFFHIKMNIFCISRRLNFDTRKVWNGIWNEKQKNIIQMSL